MKMLLTILATAVLAASSVSTALAQKEAEDRFEAIEMAEDAELVRDDADEALYAVAPQRLVIRSADGVLAAGLIGERLCANDGVCKDVVYVKRTRAILSVNDQWNSPYVVTGNGAEVIQIVPQPKVLLDADQDDDEDRDDTASDR